MPARDEFGNVILGKLVVSDKAYAAMLYAAGHTGDRPVDVISRALIAYAYMVDLEPGQMANFSLTDKPSVGGRQRRLVIWRRRNRRGK